MRTWLFVLVALPLTLALDGGEDEYHDILGEGKNNWRLVFRGTAHIKQSVFDAYTKGYNQQVDQACKTTNFQAACNTHYRNDDALDNWWMVQEVLLGVVKDGALVRTLRFNGTGSTNRDWFSQERYLASCYKDIESEPKNYFSIGGQSTNMRRFFINRNYDRCQNNAGWFVALDGPESVADCTWEKRTGDYPRILYSAGPTVTNWNDGGVAQADAFVVFVRYYPFGGKSSEYFDILNSGKREWRFTFRATSGVGVPVYEAYASGRGVPLTVADACKSTDWTAKCESHYRNCDALNNYKSPEIDQVLFGIVADGGIVKTITFNALATTMHTWFDQNRVIDACWSDFKVPKHIFSVIGHRALPVFQRTFYVNQRYGACQEDYGWVVAVDNAPGAPFCQWERGNAIPKLLYAAGPTMANWKDTANIHSADAFVVFIKYKVFNEV